ncbi:MAG: hypothetical protein JKY71_01130 [Alphaproteobacteria bacterium]|nr:hypothetical protein [Alphaproteobacteria bacterium]
MVAFVKWILIGLGILFLVVLASIYMLFNAVTGTGASDLSAEISPRYRISANAPRFERCTSEQRRLFDDDNILTGSSCSGNSCTVFSDGIEYLRSRYYYLSQDQVGDCQKVAVTNFTKETFYLGELRFGKQFLLDQGISEEQMQDNDMIVKTKSERGFQERRTQKGKVLSSGHVIGNHFVQIKYNNEVSDDMVTLYGQPVAVNY